MTRDPSVSDALGSFAVEFLLPVAEKIAVHYDPSSLIILPNLCSCKSPDRRTFGCSSLTSHAHPGELGRWPESCFREVPQTQ